ncbi:MAG: tRNA preQ1(34) S-adenosylmethionine ribosyltransferase-isomerase QueA, partial [Deltaproteobacteria bacterium]|nr:tRNA preQ1(34) S-adenosylmethionine ribosyltransferase-isomerase QueA [Deltaproteobacteria bacterium]
HMSARVKPGLRVVFEPGVVAELVSTHEERLATEGEVRLKFGGLALERAASPGNEADAEKKFEHWLERHGHVPLPPYIARDDADADKKTYQTVYAARTGSAAAPTAGFHFTPELLARLEAAGVKRAHVTLHVGLGTFRPIKTEKIEDHVMHEETFEISPEFLAAFLEARAAGRRLVAVGTTVVRALESWAAQCEARGIEPGAPGSAGVFSTRAFIYPGFRFRVVDDLLTNFHLPRSSLLVLVAAALEPAGVGVMREAYRVAVEAGYRFFSYGDAMFIRGAHE